MSVEIREFGTTKAGQPACLYSIRDRENGLCVGISNFGATVVSVVTPDRDGVMRDVVLGYDSAEEYERGMAFYGALVGRCANRIKDAEFLIGGKRYILAKNNGNNNLHSGPDTYNKRIWRTLEVGERSVKLELLSPDMDQGFPGELEICVTYSVKGNRLIIEYEAVSDRDTIVNLTNHSYFNLNGHDGASIMNHLVRINADSITEMRPDLIPTGKILPVQGTPYDFTVRKRLGENIEPSGELYLDQVRGYDDNFVLNRDGGMAASAYSTDTGILMNVYTDMPGMQMYTPDQPGSIGKKNTIYGAYGAVCFETQYFPDAIHQPGFESPILRAGDVWKSRTVYEFDVVKV